MNKSIARDKHFNMSRSSKSILAIMVGNTKATYKDMMIRAEINEEMARREPYSEDVFFGKSERKEKRENKSNNRNERK